MYHQSIFLKGLTADFVVKRLYWIDAKSDSVHSVDVDEYDDYIASYLGQI